MAAGIPSEQAVQAAERRPVHAAGVYSPVPLRSLVARLDQQARHSRREKIGHRIRLLTPVRAAEATVEGPKVVAWEQSYKHILLPIIDRNPYLSEATRQAVAVTASIAKKHTADITVVVIDESEKEQIAEHDLRIQNLRWHLGEGGYQDFGLMERLGEGKLPAAVVGEVADELNLDLVVLTMESIHAKHMDGNLLAEFVPCQVLLLPL